jgi:hypothetical protein
MSQLDNDFIDPVGGQTVPSGLPGATRVFGPKVSCGRFTRIFVSVHCVGLGVSASASEACLSALG